MNIPAEPMVRAELMEQIPHIAMLCHEHQHLFPSTIQDYILPTVVRYLTDTNNQVCSRHHRHNCGGGGTLEELS